MDIYPKKPFPGKWTRAFLLTESNFRALRRKKPNPLSMPAPLQSGTGRNVHIRLLRSPLFQKGSRDLSPVQKPGGCSPLPAHLFLFTLNN